MNNIIINSPLEQFDIINYIGIDAPIFFNFSLYITNFSYHLLLAVFILTFFNVVYTRANNKFGLYNHKVIANKLTMVNESVYMTSENLVTNQIGNKHTIYLPFIYSLFSLILIGNFLGMVPYSFSVSSHLIFTIGMSVSILIGVTIIGLVNHGIKFFSYFVPSGTPLGLVPLLVLIEFVSYIAKGFSLGIRLAGNIISGHLLLHIIAGFIYQFMISGILGFVVGLIPLALLIALFGLELAISYIQAYVYAILTCIYIKDSLELH